MTERSSQSTAKTLWLSVQNAASELEVTPRTIYRFINDGKLAAYRIGRVYRIRRADMQDFLDDGRGNRPDDPPATTNGMTTG